MGMRQYNVVAGYRLARLQKTLLMSIFIEIEQFRKPGAGKERFFAAVQRAKSRNASFHPVLEWIDEKGTGSPALLFDRNEIENRMRFLAEVSESFSVSPLLAVKSCTDPGFLELARRYLDGYDVSNLAEYALLPEDLRGKQISVTSPVMETHPEEFLVKGNSLVIVLDSRAQLEAHLAGANPCKYLLRVQGSTLLETARPADPAYYPVSRFGFTVDEIERILQTPGVRKMQPAGFHVHHGSESNRPSTYKHIIDGLVKLSGQLKGDVSCINLGGGWHHHSNQEIRDVLEYARRCFPLPCSIMLEPGRWYARRAGYAVGTVENISSAGGIVRCTLDLSGKSHLRWSNPILLHTFSEEDRQGGIVQFFGPSCYEADFIGKYYVPCQEDIVMDAGLCCGSKVVFGNISTYSIEWNTSFNGIPEAKIEWIRL